MSEGLRNTPSFKSIAFSRKPYRTPDPSGTFYCVSSRDPFCFDPKTPPMKLVHCREKRGKRKKKASKNKKNTRNKWKAIKRRNSFQPHLHQPLWELPNTFFLYQLGGPKPTIPTQMMADEFKFSLVRNSELHCRGRCRFHSCPRPISMVDADMVSCCLHALVLSICRRSNCGDVGIRITLQVQRQI